MRHGTGVGGFGIAMRFLSLYHSWEFSEGTWIGNKTRNKGRANLEWKELNECTERMGSLVALHVQLLCWHDDETDMRCRQLFKLSML